MHYAVGGKESIDDEGGASFALAPFAVAAMHYEGVSGDAVADVIAIATALE
jgi:hypothetical protein